MALVKYRQSIFCLLIYGIVYYIRNIKQRCHNRLICAELYNTPTYKIYVCVHYLKFYEVCIMFQVHFNYETISMNVYRIIITTFESERINIYKIFVQILDDTLWTSSKYNDLKFYSRLILYYMLYSLSNKPTTNFQLLY